MKEFEDYIKEAYEEYLKMPKATLQDNRVELYEKGWYIRTGLGIVSPDPHRHYTLIEFAFHCGKNKELYERFLQK